MSFPLTKIKYNIKKNIYEVKSTFISSSLQNWFHPNVMNINPVYSGLFEMFVTEKNTGNNNFIEYCVVSRLSSNLNQAFVIQSNLDKYHILCVIVKPAQNLNIVDVTVEVSKTYMDKIKFCGNYKTEIKDGKVKFYKNAIYDKDIFCYKIADITKINANEPSTTNFSFTSNCSSTSNGSFEIEKNNNKYELWIYFKRDQKDYSSIEHALTIQSQ